MIRATMLIAMLIMLAARGALAGETSRAEQAGREAFQQPDFPWYDAERDALRPIELPELREPTRETSDAASSLPSISLSPLAVIAWGALGLLLVVAAALIVWAWRSLPEGESSKRAGPGRTIDRSGDLDALPVSDLRDAPSLWAAADAAYRAGRYREAMIYLFSYQLLLLDRGHFIRLARGKTNRQYLRELTSHDRLRELMSTSVGTFEEAFFGGRALERGEFETCWARVGEFQGLTAATP